MRRNQCEITDSKKIERILAATTIGRMATFGSDGYPYITPVNFVYHKGNIYFHSAPVGEKLNNIVVNPNVCFEVDIPLAYLDSEFNPHDGICRLHQFFHCVIIRGKASLIRDDQQKADCLNALVTKHERRTNHEQVTREMTGFSGCVVVEIKPTSITAKTDLFQYKSADIRIKLAKYLSNRNEPGDSETVASIFTGQEES